MFSTKKTVQKINPFNRTCIGVDTIHPYTVHINLIRVDFWRVIVLFAGLFIFLSAVDLSQNTLFYYITGVSIGIFASFLVLLYFLGKLLPKRKMMYGALIGGYAVGIYLVQFLWENLQLIMVSYQTYVFWYVLITGLISFVVCYRFGPPKNQRSRNLIKWGLQLAAVVMIFFSSHFEEATTAIILLTAMFYYFPQSFVRQVSGLATIRVFFRYVRTLGVGSFSIVCIGLVSMCYGNLAPFLLLRNHLGKAETLRFLLYSKNATSWKRQKTTFNNSISTERCY